MASTIRVLCVDDHRLMREGIARIVGVQPDMTVVAQASDGEQAVAQFLKFRPDVTREIDLIEEIARTRGLDHVPLADRLPIMIHAPQPSERAMRELASTLSGMGFFEAVTFTFVTPAQAAPFMPAGLAPLVVDDERRKADGTLRPSVIPSLLACRAANHARRATVPGGIRLYEIASVFAERGGGHVENRNLGLCMDVPGAGKKRSVEDRQAGVRIMRGAIESIVRAMAGADGALEIKPGVAPFPACDAGACAGITLDGKALGYLGLLAPAVQGQFDLEVPQVVAEVNVAALVDRYPPPALVRALPAFPHIERDLSLVLREDVSWERVRALVEGAGLPRLEACEFIGTYRGKQYGEGRKSMTLRLRFRDAGRTLRHEEVDPEVNAVVERARCRLGAELRL